MSTGLEKRSTLRTFYNELRPRADALNYPIVICVAIEYEKRRMVSRGKYHRPIDPMHLLHDLFSFFFFLSLFLSSLFFFFNSMQLRNKKFQKFILKYFHYFFNFKIIFNLISTRNSIYIIEINIAIVVNIVVKIVVFHVYLTFFFFIIFNLSHKNIFTVLLIKKSIDKY